MPVFDFNDIDSYGGTIMSKNFDENVTSDGWAQKGGGTLGNAIKLQIPYQTLTNSFYVVSFRKPEYPFHNHLTTILWQILDGTLLSGRHADQLMSPKIAYSPVPLRTRPFRRSILSYGVRGQ